MIDSKYNPKTIEAKWQAKWASQNLFQTRLQPDKPKFYYLDMFPYPSGALHVGHVRNYAIGDAVARYRVMRGFSVLHPMGFDAFGLPAELAAVKNQVHPATWTESCIVDMKAQFEKLGIAFDWEKEVVTCRPDYYKWTQWLFIQMYNAGLIERKSALVNWNPVTQTVLANEQVKDGRDERTGDLVEQKQLTQWFAKTTKYAARLLDDLEKLPDWPERVVKAQRAWIGRSEGVSFSFLVKGTNKPIEVFTTRVDTVFGVTYMVLSPDHELVEELVKNTEYETPAREFRDHVARQKDEQRDYGDEIPKEGIFTGAFCINPMTGEDVPIWLANYVVSDYGSGAVMAVPAHDERDFEFAKQYDLPIRAVISPASGSDGPASGNASPAAGSVFPAPGSSFPTSRKSLPDAGKSLPAAGEALPDAGPSLPAAYTDKENGILVNSGEFDGLNPVQAREKIAEKMEELGIGARTTNYRLRDWCLSRQRYWGCPIPVIYCEDGSIETVPEEQLPVLHPTDVEFSGAGNPLASSRGFIETTDSQGRPARRETDTMDTFVDSSWYFLRFCDPKNADAPFSREAVDQWMPIDQYVGGVEHATMHLIYARFWTKVLFDLGLVGVEEPFPRLFTQGMVTMFSEKTGDVQKMSKSKGNVVSLDEAVERFGADATRLMTLFMGPPAQDAEWKKGESDSTFAGTFRFLERVWRVCTAMPFEANWRGSNFQNLGEAETKLRRQTHQTIQKVGNDIERFNMNTAISALMVQVNEMQAYLNAGGQHGAAYSEAIENLLTILSPFAPHIADELGEKLGFATSFYEVSWPQFDAEVAKESEIVIPVQVNGKLKTRLSVSAEISRDELEKAALENAEIAAVLAGKTPKKVIVVPGRLVNVVV